MTDVLVKPDTHEARERAARIRLGIASYLTTLADIRAAWDQRDWAALGYEDWDSYLDGEFSETRLRVPAEHRVKAITELRMAGMSTRAIASALNVSQATAARDVRQLSQTTQLEQPERIKSLDGKERPAAQTKTAKPVAGETASTPASTPVQPVAAPSRRLTDDTNFGTTEGAETRRTGSLTPESAPAARPDEKPAPERAPMPPLTEEDAERRSRMFIEDIGGLFAALHPSPIGWLTRTWRPVPFSSRNLPLVRDAFTPDGLRTLSDHLRALADHLDQNGISL